MQTERSADLFGFVAVEGHAVVAAFDGGKMTSEAGALLLGATDRAIRLVERFAGCFKDHRAPDLIEHRVVTLVGQLVFGASWKRGARIARRWPAVRILLRGDSGFARDDLMAWCESNTVDFLFGLARNNRLVAQIETELAEAAELSARTGKPWAFSPRA
jgi:hypothetical protein